MTFDELLVAVWHSQVAEPGLLGSTVHGAFRQFARSARFPPPGFPRLPLLAGLVVGLESLVVLPPSLPGRPLDSASVYRNIVLK